MALSPALKKMVSDAKHKTEVEQLHMSADFLVGEVRDWPQMLELAGQASNDALLASVHSLYGRAHALNDKLGGDMEAPDSLWRELHELEIVRNTLHPLVDSEFRRGNFVDA